MIVDDKDLGDITTCISCIHLISIVERQCAAFPQRIPEEIWTGENKHRKKVDGDQGIIYYKNPNQKENQ